MKNVIKIFVGLLLMYFGFKLGIDTNEMIDKGEIKKYKNLCESGIMTKGYLTDSIENKNIKYTYNLEYSYLANGAKYKLNRTAPIGTFEDSISVWFDKDSPSVHSTSEPCNFLKNNIQSKEIGNPKFYTVFGIILVFIGLILLINSIRELIGI